MPLSARAKTLFHRFLKFIAAAFVVFLVGIFSYSCATQRALNREIAEADRDPQTGVIYGTEAVSLPADAPTSVSAGCLMIHGFCGARSDLGMLGEDLAQHGFAVRLMRLPGHGTTPRDFAQQTPQAHIDAVMDEFQQLREKYDRVYVVGFSMGGTLATLLASEEEVDRLVLVAPYYGVNYRWYYVLPAETWNALFRHVIPYVNKSSGYVRLNDRTHADKIFSYHTIPTSGAHQLVVLGKRARKRSTLEQIDCPVLLIHSWGDEAASPSAAEKVFEKIGSPKKNVIWFERSNHLILWDYDKDEVTDHIVDFLTR